MAGLAEEALKSAAVNGLALKGPVGTVEPKVTVSSNCVARPGRPPTWPLRSVMVSAWAAEQTAEIRARETTRAMGRLVRFASMFNPPLDGSGVCGTPRLEGEGRNLAGCRKKNHGAWVGSNRVWGDGGLGGCWGCQSRGTVAA